MKVSRKIVLIVAPVTFLLFATISYEGWAVWYWSASEVARGKLVCEIADLKCKYVAMEVAEHNRKAMQDNSLTERPWPVPPDEQELLEWNRTRPNPWRLASIAGLGVDESDFKHPYNPYPLGIELHLLKQELERARIEGALLEKQVEAKRRDVDELMRKFSHRNY